MLRPDFYDDRRMPAKMQAGVSMPQDNKTSENGVENTNPTILVVDDEPVNVLVLKGILNNAGFNVLTAENGRRGREIAIEQRPDLVLLDIMMPDEDGFETCRRLQQAPETTDTPIIFISALSDVDNKVRGLEAGAVDYITKPFENAEVLARIRLHLKLKLAYRAVIEEQAAKLQQLADAQQSILTTPEDYPEAGFAVEYAPALEAGGDFYDVLAVGGKSICYFVADICGHDLGASYVTSSLKALLRQNSGPLYTPTETIKNINSILKYVLKEGKFLTAQGCWLNRDRRTMNVINAGHPPAVFIDGSGTASLVKAEGDILGVFETICVEPQVLTVQPGDRIYMYTDGLLERFGEHKRSYNEGMALLVKHLESVAGLPLAEAVASAAGEFFPTRSDQKDDAVLLGVEV